MLRPALLILLTLFFLARAGAVLTDYPADSLVTIPREMESTPGSVTIRHYAPPAEDENDVYLIPYSGKSLRFDPISYTVRNRNTGELIEGDNLRRFKHNHLRAKHFGYFRQLPVARVEVLRENPYRVKNQNFEIAAYEIVLNFEPMEDSPLIDAAFNEGPYAEFCRAALGEIEKFAKTFEQSPREGPNAWIPPNGSLSFPVSDDGLYSIDGGWLLEAGADPESFPPEEIRLFSRGREIPLIVTGAEGAGFAGGQRILFYGEQSESQYTRERIYYLTLASPGDSEPLRMAETVEAPPEAQDVRTFRREIQAIDDMEFKTDMGAFLTIKAMKWVGPQVDENGIVEAEFDLPALAPQAERPVEAEALFHSDGGVMHRLDYTVIHQGAEIASGRLRTDQAIKFELPADTLQEKNNRLTIEFTSEREQEFTRLFLDDLNLRYDSLIQAEPSPLRVNFQDAAWLESGPARLQTYGYRSARRTLAFDVTDPAAPKVVPLSGRPSQLETSVSLTSGTAVIFADSRQIPRPPAGVVLDSRDIRNRDQLADVVQIYHPDFVEAVRLHAKDLEAAGYTTAAFTTKEIYRAFSNGELSPDAIRNFLAFAVYDWRGAAGKPEIRTGPHTAILYGDSTGDGRNAAKQDLPNFLPAPVIPSARGRTDNEVVSDSWYSWLTPGDEIADIVIGRISSSTPEEALATVRNIISYRQLQDTPQEWTHRMVSVADTGEFEDSIYALEDAVNSGRVENTLLNADDFLWEDNYYLPSSVIDDELLSKASPLLTKAIENSFEEGAAVVTYFGHGAPNLWSNQRFWFGGGTPNSDILRLDNEGRLPIVTSFTCNNATINFPLKPWNISIAEDFMRHEKKGAVTCFMPSGPGFIRQHEIIARGFMLGWAQLNIRNHGSLAELARLSHQAWEGSDDHSRMYILLGDPTLNIPPAAVEPSSRQNRDPNAPMKIVKVHEEEDANDTLAYYVHLYPESESVKQQPPQSLKLTMEVYNAQGDLAERRTETFRIDPSRSKDAPVSELLRAEEEGRIPQNGRLITLQNHHPETNGVYLTRFSINHPSGAPSSQKHQERWKAVGELPAHPVLLAPTVHRNQNTRGNRQVIGDVYSPAESAEGSVMAHFRQGSAAHHAVQPYSPASTDRNRRLTFDLPDDWNIFQPFTAEFTFEPEEGETVSLGEVSFTGNENPDLAIVEDSLRVEPDRLSAGLTVFVHGELKNHGAEAAGRFEVGLYYEGGSEPLRNLTGPSLQRFTSLQPGESRPFRLRWDPRENAGEHTLEVRADPSENLLDSNRGDNTVSIPIKVYTKWELYTAGINWAAGDDPNEVVLTATIGNRGQTDAGAVAVNFFRTQDMNEEDKLGEVILDAVPAESTVQARYEWQLTGEQADAPDTDPSFSIALRGSLQRINSVSQEP